MSPKLSALWSSQGRLGRSGYLVLGLTLFALKHNIDRVVAAYFGYPWTVFNYWVFATPSGLADITRREVNFYLVLMGIALPFIFIGTLLTLRRLRDANLPLWFVVFFFLPFINLIFFIVLVVLPAKDALQDQSKFGLRISKLIPRGEFGSAFVGILTTAVLAALVTAFGASGLGSYGWGIFVGIPFFLGLNSVLIYGVHEPRSLGKCLLVALLSTGLAGMALFAIAVEGLICLMMAFPLAVLLALFGGAVGFIIQERRTYAPDRLRVVSIVFVLMPLLILLEYSIGETPALNSVTTSVVINARPETVWTNVVSFAELPPPNEALFKTGIAFPVRAEISGRGPGAVRHCVFSTGAFVEPITVWDEPRLLRFDVTSQPRAMEEMSLYNDLRPPHLENYLISRKGQFELKPAPNGGTILEGTTWYQNRFWPASYWSLWSDYIIHRIHKRVLDHIKNLAEQTQP